MPKRLAITIAGAVSLGSYEAGVLYEVLDAIHQHNVVPGTPDEERIEVDVLTGASAGGMIAAIVAHKMLYSADEFRDPYDNPLYNVWVNRSIWLACWIQWMTVHRRASRRCAPSSRRIWWNGLRTPQ